MSASKRALSLVLVAILMACAFPVTSIPAAAAADDAWVAMDSGTASNLAAVWGSSSSNVFAVGAGGTILKYNGANWQAMNSPITSNLNCIWGSSANSVFAVGAGGSILFYNGSVWSAMTSGVSAALNGVWGSSASDVFVVGGGGTILHYNGISWSAMTSGTAIDLNAVWGTSGSDVYAVGALGTILHYNGIAWSDMGYTGPEIHGIWGSGPADIRAVGGCNLCTHYDGSAWLPPPGFCISSNNMAVWGSAANHVFIAGYNGVAMTPYSGYIRYFNGASWVDMDTPHCLPLKDISGTDGNNIFAVGNSGTILHYGIPTISSVTPTSGGKDTRIVITGTNFTGATAVTFGGTRAARFKVNSATQITAYLGTGATGKVRVTNTYGTGASNATFTFNAPEEQIGTTPKGSWLPGTTSTATPTQSVQQLPVSMASISVKSASLSATKVAPGSPVTVTADVVNTGNTNGSSSIQIHVNGEVDTTQGVTVSSGGSTPVTFNVTRDEPGTYSVYVGGTNAGSFTVDQFSPDSILIISGVLVFFAFILGVIYVTRKRQA